MPSAECGWFLLWSVRQSSASICASSKVKKSSWFSSSSRRRPGRESTDPPARDRAGSARTAPLVTPFPAPLRSTIVVSSKEFAIGRGWSHFKAGGFQRTSQRMVVYGTESSCSKRSVGAAQPSVLRGRVLISSPTTARSCGVCVRRHGCCRSSLGAPWSRATSRTTGSNAQGRRMRRLYPGR